MLPSTKCTHCHPIFWKQQKQHPMFLFFSVPSSSMRRLLKGKRGINMPFPFRGARRAFVVGASKSGTNVLLRTSETPKLRRSTQTPLATSSSVGGRDFSEKQHLFCIKCIIRCCLIDPIQQKVLHITVLPETNKVTQSDSEKCPLNFRLKCSSPAILGR